MYKHLHIIKLNYLPYPCNKILLSKIQGSENTKVKIESHNYLKMENTEKFEISTTQRGKRKIICDGFTFVKKKNLAGDKELFECTKRRELPICYATLCFKDDDIISQKTAIAMHPMRQKTKLQKYEKRLKLEPVKQWNHRNRYCSMW